jgi:ABC-type spermidine/putrescine transport system permease subunit II
MYIETATLSAVANMSPHAERQTPSVGHGFEDLSAFTLDKLRISIKLALAFSTISLFCGLVAAYWFMRMRRRFRHE